MSWAATERLRIDGSVTFLDSKLTKDFCENLDSTGLSTPSTTSAIRSPRTGANLNPCPDPPAATVRPSRPGSLAIQKCSS